MSAVKRSVVPGLKEPGPGKISDEVRALAARGNVTSEELAGHAFNSWDWEALVPALTDEALLGVVEHATLNSSPKVRQDLPCLTYDEAMAHLYGPELARRLRERGVELAKLRPGPPWLPELIKALGWQGGHWNGALRSVEELAEIAKWSRCYVASWGNRTASFDDAAVALEWLVVRMFEQDRGSIDGYVHELIGRGGGEANLAGVAWWKSHGEVRTGLTGSDVVRSYEGRDGKIYEDLGADGSREVPS